MKIYLVGGAVRDQLLGRPVQDRDWVVVGANASELLAKGYQKVGSDFPVFLHPETREEYALARTERRSGFGHKGFVTVSTSDVTLEQDLFRRDLTINAMALDDTGALIDPWGGKDDLQARLLRAVSPAFAEDPLRVLRVARFAAQLPGFQVAGETLKLMESMVRDHRLDELPAERVWQELDKTLHAAVPHRFIDILAGIGALSPFFLEWQNRTPADTGDLFHGDEQFAVWCEDLLTRQIEVLCTRLRVPNRTRDFALRVNLSREVLATWQLSDTGQLLQVLERIRAFHEPQMAEAVLALLERRLGVNLEKIRDTVQSMRGITADAFAGLSGVNLGAAIRQARIQMLLTAQRLR